MVIAPVDAERMARELLAALPKRLRHVEAVARRATTVGADLTYDDSNMAIASAWLHDIGYAAGLVRSGFHHLDGADYLSARGEHRLAGLVAYHSAGWEEARLRDLAGELSAFPDEDSDVSRLLTYCDLTTRSDGHHVSLEERLVDVRDRYGDDHVVSRALEEALPRLAGIVASVERRLAVRVTR